MYGVTFKDNKEPAFAGLKMFQASAACLNFATAKYFCTQTKIYIVGVVLFLSMIGLTVLEVKRRRQEKKENAPPVKDENKFENSAVAEAPVEKKNIGPTPV